MAPFKIRRRIAAYSLLAGMIAAPMWSAPRAVPPKPIALAEQGSRLKPKQPSDRLTPKHPDNRLKPKHLDDRSKPKQTPLPGKTKEGVRSKAEKSKREKDQQDELGNQQSMRLQMYMDRKSKTDAALSNTMKKQADTRQGITKNQK